MEKLHDLRRDYSRHELDLDAVDADPIVQFKAWFKDAMNGGVTEPNAMTLATVSQDGQPSVRVMLLKEVNPMGFVFFTNYSSRKGQHMTDNPRVALNFFWEPLERQVRIEGMVAKIAPDDSDAYFKSRPLGSQIGAWSSPQSQEIESRQWLENQVSEFQSKFQESIPRPDHWGGYLVSPETIEFWQGRPSRLHDRIVYTKKGSEWRIARLAP